MTIPDQLQHLIRSDQPLSPLVWLGIGGPAHFFAEPVDVWVILGGSLILAAVSFITWREAVLKRRPITPPSPATKL